MTNAIRAAQNADLLQLALSPRGGREAASSDTGEVAFARLRGVDSFGLAEGKPAGSLPVGAAAERVGCAGSKIEDHALQRFQSPGAEAFHRDEIGSRDVGQERADLFAGVDGEGGGNRKGSGVGGVGGSVRDLESRSLRSRECGGQRVVA